MPRVCMFGHFDPAHPRNEQVKRAFRDLGWSVVGAQRDGPLPQRYRGLWHHIDALDCDLIWVGFPGYTDVPLARLIASRRAIPLVFDAYYSLYDGSILDRGTFRRISARAAYLRILEITSSHLADRVVLDTPSNAARFARRMALGPGRAAVLRVGSESDGARSDLEESVTPARSTATEPVSVVFVGSFIPLHGVDAIVRAAGTVGSTHPTIRFTLIGDGQTRIAAQALARSLRCTNISWLPRLARAQADAHLCRADIALGTFGGSVKAGLVVANKVVDALAVGTPVITASSAATREALQHGDDAWLCSPQSGNALATSIMTLAADPALRRRLALGGARTYARTFSPDALRSQVGVIAADVAGHRAP